MRKLSARYYAQIIWQVWLKAGAAERSDVVKAFIMLLHRDRTLKLMPRILEQVQRLEDQKNHVTRVKVEVTEQGVAIGVEHKLHDVLGPVATDVSVNPAIIGGAQVKIGDELIDGSIATQLQRLQHHLSTAKT